MTSRLWISEREFESAKIEKSKWVQYTTDLLGILFDNNTLLEEFASRRPQVAVGGGLTFSEKVKEFQESMDDYLLRLESIYERLDLAPEVGDKPTGRSGPAAQSSTIFISHSSEDEDIIRVINQAFEELSLTPLFNEKTPSGIPAEATIV